MWHKVKMAVFLFLLFLDIQIEGARFNCYSCTYTRSSDPTVNYECVTSPENFTVGSPTISCTAPYMCITKVLYNQDMTHIRSVTRNCQVQQDTCEGQRCCNEAGVYPSCEYKCREELCNDNNPEEHFRSDTESNDGTGDGTALSCGWMLMLLLYFSNFLLL